MGRAAEVKGGGRMTHLRNDGKRLLQEAVGEVLPVVVHHPGAQCTVHLQSEGVLVPLLRHRSHVVH